MNTEAESAKGTEPESHRLASQFESGASAWIRSDSSTIR